MALRRPLIIDAGQVQRKVQTDTVEGIPHDHQHVSSDAQSDTTSTTYVNKLTLNIGALTGTYRIIWSAEVNTTSAGKPCGIRVENTTDVATLAEMEPYNAVTGQWANASGHVEIVMAGVAKAIAIEFKAGSGGGPPATASIRRARMSLQRVA